MLLENIFLHFLKVVTLSGLKFGYVKPLDELTIRRSIIIECP